MNMSEKYNEITIELPKDKWEKIQVISQNQQITIDELINQWLQKYFEYLKQTKSAAETAH